MAAVLIPLMAGCPNLWVGEQRTGDASSACGRQATAILSLILPLPLWSQSIRCTKELAGGSKTTCPLVAATSHNLVRELRPRLHLQQQTAPFPDPGLVMGERVRHSVSLSQQHYEGPDLIEPHLEAAPVLAEQRGLDELAPRQLPTAGGLRAQNRRMELAAVLVALKPPVQSPGRNAQEVGRIGL